VKGRPGDIGTEETEGLREGETMINSDLSDGFKNKRKNIKRQRLRQEIKE